MKGITCILLIFFGTICMKANSQNENTMVELRDTIEINTTIAAVANWFENLDTNFVRWNKRHTEFCTLRTQPQRVVRAAAPYPNRSRRPASLALWRQRNRT